MERWEPGFPRVVCLCGSTRFRDAYIQANRSETLAGRVVLSVGMFGHDEGIDMDGPIKAGLDQLHLRKIDLADEVLVLNVGGYIGESTRREIEYAKQRRRRIRYLEEPGRVDLVAPAPVGDPFWFDIEATVAQLRRILTASAEELDQWRNGDEAAVAIDRACRILEWVAIRQDQRPTHSPTRKPETRSDTCRSSAEA